MSARRALAVGLTTLVLAAAVGVGSDGQSARAAAAGDEPAFTASKVVTRDLLAPDGTVASTDSRTVTVTADVTQELRGRQVMTVHWSGAHPSGGIVGNVLDLSAWVSTEYPMVVMQCRGDDSAADPAAHISPQTCWTTVGANERRLGGLAAGGGDIYRHDKYASAEEKAASVPSQADWPSVCGDGEAAGTDLWPKRIIPFVAAKGTAYWRCGAEGQGFAPEMGTSSALGPNEKAEITRTDGSGVTHVEVRTAAENASLGCSATVPCAIVLIPIMGISCDSPTPTCNQEGLRPAGSLYSDQLPAATAVTGQLWGSASNWRNRITIPITVAATDARCADSVARPTVQLYGSPLMLEAAEQWRPAYCGRPDRFVLNVNDKSEPSGFEALRDGYGTGVLSTYKDVGAPAMPLGYAPVAVSGFAIAFVIDIPDGGGQLDHLNLSPRLLAKLMTASYWGGNFSADAVAQRPDLAHNPRSLQFDPEFRELNPALTSSSFAWNQSLLYFSQLMGLNAPSDMMQALTSYIAADPEAKAFIDGTPDPWGMTVNSAYKGTALPVSDWQLADPWTVPGATGCDASQSMPWFSKVLAPVSDPHRIAQDLLTASPEAIYLNAVVPNTDACRTYRQPALPQGVRAMIGLVTLADAERYALPVASLRTTGTGPRATYVAPTPAALAAGAALMTSAGPGEPFVPDADRLHQSAVAYPGTMVVHAAIPLTGLDASAAVDAAAFVAIALSEGQVQGTGTGELPAGYLPITSTGPTTDLMTAAALVARAVAVQSGPMTPAPTSAPAATPAAAPPPAQPAGTAGAAVQSQVLAAQATPVPGLPAPTASSTALAGPVGSTPTAAVHGPLRAVLPTGAVLAALAAVGVPLLRRTPREER